MVAQINILNNQGEQMTKACQNAQHIEPKVKDKNLRLQQGQVYRLENFISETTGKQGKDSPRYEGSGGSSG